MEEISLFSLLFSGIISSASNLIPNDVPYQFIPKDGKHLVLKGTLNNPRSTAVNDEPNAQILLLTLDKPIFFKGAACGDVKQKKITISHPDAAVFQGKRVIVQGMVLCGAWSQKEYYINDYSIQLLDE